MTALFTLPGQTAFNNLEVVPFARLYFYQTGTSTPQPVYTTEALNVAHASPVEADADGLFPAIYLDPTLPSYRATLNDGNDVLIKQWDGVPSTQGVQQAVRLESTNPYLFWYDTDGTANLRKYRARASGSSWEVQLANDAENVFTTILQYDASTGILYSNATEVAVTSAGSFTGTLTGCTTSPTQTFYYRKVNNLVSIWLEANLVGTSNSTSMSVTGLPVAIQPTFPKRMYCANVEDNGLIWAGSVAISGQMNFALLGAGFSYVIDDDAFTNSGEKGVRAGWNVTYPIS